MLLEENLQVSESFVAKTHLGHLPWRTGGILRLTISKLHG